MTDPIELQEEPESDEDSLMNDFFEYLLSLIVMMVVILFFAGLCYLFN